MNLNPHFLEFSKCLEAHKVRYLLIGGYAVSFHGWPRYTKDIDFWIADDEENQARVVAALREFAFPDLEASVLVEANAMLRFGVPPFQIEILKRISGIVFEEAWPKRVIWNEGGFSIPVIGLGELRRNKTVSGRTQDRADCENLPDPDSGSAAE